MAPSTQGQRPWFRFLFSMFPELTLASDWPMGTSGSYDRGMAAGGEESNDAAARVRKLNHDFYSREPSTYFLFRLRNLVLSAGRGLDLEQLVAEGVEVGVFDLAGDDAKRPSSLDEEQQGDQHAFVTLETEVLLHHVSETLLRLYLVHEQSSPCPWVAISRERSPRRFKRKVESLLERLNTPEGREQMCQTFFGTTDRSTFGDEAPTEETWEKLADSSRLWLSWFARYILDSDVYNAAKHGLGVYPQRIALKVEIDGQALLNGSGPCLEYLHSIRDENEKRQWRRATKWVQWDRLFGAIHIACQLIDRLWTVARVRYGESQHLQLELAVFASPADLLHGEEMALTKFSHSLGFDADALP